MKDNSPLRTLLIYGLLLGGTAIFTLPFLWMAGRSVMVDRELFASDLSFLPAAPIPARTSPYLDIRAVPKPADEAAFEKARAPILAAFDASGWAAPGWLTQTNGLREAAAAGLYRRLQDLLPADAWDNPAALEPQLRQRVNPELVDGVMRNLIRGLTVGGIRARSIDLQEEVITLKAPASKLWALDHSTGVTIADTTENNQPQGVIQYDFAQRGGKDIVLNSTFDLPFQADRIRRLEFSFRPDDSWHALRFRLEYGGKVYETVRPQWLGEREWTVVTLQPEGPDDAYDSTKIRFWIPWREVAGAASDVTAPNQMRVTLTVAESNRADAWRAKITRNYTGAMTNMPFWRYTLTSVMLVILNIIGSILSCSLAAFAYARMQWPGRNFSFMLLLATMMIPPQVTMIPFFLIIRYLGWYNTLTPLWAMSFFGNAFNIFLLVQFMKGIPRDLEDAARIDGCNSLQTWWHVFIPLVKPTLACIAIFTFMGVWNDFMGPLIYLGDQRLYPLSLGLYAFNVQAGGNAGMMMAGSLLMTIPVIAIFFMAQRYFIQGITLTGIK